MGYILPVDFHQYTQYQRRNISKKQKTDLALERVFRTELRELKRDQNEQKNDELDAKVDTSIVSHLYQPSESKYIDQNSKQLADITGKGRYFSETI